MATNSTYKHLPWIALTSLAIYIHAYGWLDAHHWTWPPLDRWLYQRRNDWLFNKSYRIPILAIIAALATRIPKSKKTVFNTEAEQFPQQEKRRTNEYSINLPYTFTYSGRIRRGWINLTEPFRGLLVMGSPGSGKSYYIIKPLIEQLVKKNFTVFVYDFKYPDLTSHVWSCGPKNQFHIVQFDDLARTKRCNPIHPTTLADLSEAAGASRILLLGLNREWIRRQGDFFVESAINFLTALIWFLKKYDKGRLCTLPHVIELMQTPYQELFSVLRTEPDIAFLLSPFLSAYQEDVMPQLEGQIAGAKISLARLSTPHLYYVLSGHDVDLDINSPDHPSVICMGNTPGKQEVYGAVLSLYVSRMVRLVNKPGGLPCALVFDEFPTLYFHGMDTLLATARSNRVAATLAVQDMSQLRKEYGREAGEVLLNLTGNVLSGQVSGDSARQLSERFGRILQQRQSTHQGVKEQTSSTAPHLDPALPPSRMATLSAGEMVGILSEGERKLVHGRLNPPRLPDPAPLPHINEPPTEETIANGYRKIKQEIKDLVEGAMERIQHEPGFKHLLVQRRSDSLKRSPG